jgi:hypothetical protein
VQTMRSAMDNWRRYSEQDDDGRSG